MVHHLETTKLQLASGASKCLELRKFFANTEYFYRERVSA